MYMYLDISCTNGALQNLGALSGRIPCIGSGPALPHLQFSGSPRAPSHEQGRLPGL
jgi:hypothetical protein